jgi:hypothetical protein
MVVAGGMGTIVDSIFSVICVRGVIYSRVKNLLCETVRPLIGRTCQHWLSLHHTAFWHSKRHFALLRRRGGGALFSFSLHFRRA